MIGTTPEFGDDKPENGIAGHHSYTILSAIELSNGVRLLKVRNPWGSEVFKGRWSDSSNLWTNKFKNEV